MRALRYLNLSQNKFLEFILEYNSYESFQMLDLSANQLTNMPNIKSMN